MKLVPLAEHLFTYVYIVFCPPSAAKDSPRSGKEGGEEDGW